METECLTTFAQELSLDLVKDIRELIKHCDVKEYWEWRYGACIYTQQKKNNPLCG
jgi:hypothetical protein